MTFEQYALQLNDLTTEERVSVLFIFLGKLDGHFKSDLTKKALTQDQILQLLKESIKSI